MQNQLQQRRCHISDGRNGKSRTRGRATCVVFVWSINYGEVHQAWRAAASGNLGTWELRNFEIWGPGNPETWRSGDLEIQKFGIQQIKWQTKDSWLVSDIFPERWGSACHQIETEQSPQYLLPHLRWIAARFQKNNTCLIFFSFLDFDGPFLGQDGSRNNRMP